MTEFIYNPSDFHSQYGSYTDSEFELIRMRTDNLFDVYQNFKNEICNTINDDDCGFYLNKSIIYQIAFLYANELKVLKTFHKLGEGTNGYRRSAFLSRLVSKMRPIHIRDIDPKAKGREQETKILLDVNENYALRARLIIL